MDAFVQDGVLQGESPESNSAPGIAIPWSRFPQTARVT
jgi:hypothetical protein